MTPAFWFNYALALCVVVALLIIGVGVGLGLLKLISRFMLRGWWNTTIILAACFVVAMFSLAFVTEAVHGATSTSGVLVFLAPIIAFPAAIAVAIGRIVQQFRRHETSS